jgi:phenylalanyl-tRNA synthetase beta chain
MTGGTTSSSSKGWLELGILFIYGEEEVKRVKTKKQLILNMKISLSLIKKFIDVGLNVDEIASLLTLAGIEVDKIENQTPSFSGVVAADVIEASKHPSSDKLSIAKVTDGKNTYEVICGAPNCKKGMRTAFAKIGSSVTLPSGEKKIIKNIKIRDVESFGMLCSGKELNIIEDATKILELPKEVTLGSDLSALCDPVFEISLTPNLGHCMSALGIARELAALTGKKISYPSFSISETTEKIENKINVEIEQESLCKRYSCRLINSISLTQSPFWLVKSLDNCGIRSVNVIVDILNYTMILFGQPMHAFDYKKIEGKTIKVTKNIKKQLFVGLDKVEREIPINALLIEDKEKTIAIAGIIGGENSCVDNKTTSILIESAYFDFLSIRKASRELNLRTESALRFEKNIDPNKVVQALNFACSLIKEICGESKLCQGTIDNKRGEFTKKTIHCRVSRVNKILGTKLNQSEVQSIFTKLDFDISNGDKETFDVQPPTYRNDISEEIDLIEEVGRIYGYNNIPKPPPVFSTGKSLDSSLYFFERKIKEKLISEGLQEIITCDLISPSYAKIMQKESIPKDAFISVIHAKSSEQSVLRPSLLPTFLEVAKYNQDHQNKNLNAFELSRIHMRHDKTIEEQSVIAILLTGNEAPYNWDTKEKPIDFYNLKGIVENLMDSMGLKVNFTVSSHPTLHPGRQAEIFLGSTPLGVIGEVNESISSSFSIKQRLYFAEINSQKIYENKKDLFAFSHLVSFPSSERDATITLEEQYPLANILSLKEKISSSLLEDIKLIDIYRDEQIGKTKKNATFRFIYRDTKKTISFENVEKEHEKVLSSISNLIENSSCK